MSAAEVPLGPPPEPPISAGAALAGTFASPGKTFERLAKKPTWWLPFVLLLLTSIGAHFAIAPKIDMERTVRQSMEKQAEQSGRTVSEADVARGVSFAQIFMHWYVSVAGAVLFFFLIALVLWGTAQAFGGETRFSQILAVWSHAQIPGILGALLKIPVFLARPDTSVLGDEVDSVLKSNVGAFLASDAPAALRSLLSSLDLFTILTLVILVIGFRRLPGLTKATGAAVPLVPWVLVVVVKVLWHLVKG